MSKKQFSLLERVRSFKYALNGLRILFKEEHNARVHLFFAFSAIIAAYLLSISLLEWISILIAIGLVFSLELINSSIESLADFTSPEKNE